MIFNQWYAVLPSKAVKPGSLLGVKRLNLELVFFRNQKGEIGCVTDKCTHRGAALSIGKVKDGCLKCPFHGIEFDKRGKCTFIPANGRSSTADISRYNVKSYMVREAHGIIYLWYGDDDKTEKVLPSFNDFVDKTYVFSEIEDHWESHYSRCIENQLDTVHVPIVHYNTIGRGNMTLVNGPKVEFDGRILRTSANNEKDIGQVPKLPSECVINPTHLDFMFPNLWMNHISSKIMVIIYFAPVDEENTVLYIRFYCKITDKRILNTFIAYLGKYANRVIERQDKRIVITQKPKASSLKMHEKLIVGDGPIIMYRSLREELKQKNNVT